VSGAEISLYRIQRGALLAAVVNFRVLLHLATKPSVLCRDLNVSIAAMFQEEGRGWSYPPGTSIYRKSETSCLCAWRTGWL